MIELTIVQQVAVYFLPILFAITLHEAAHAGVASYFGDTTAKMLGRLTINPVRHIDLLGTIIIPLLTLALTQFSFVFGWAKPVPINTANFKNPRRDFALSTLAGPGVNLVMAFIWALLLKIILILNMQPSNFILFFILAARAGIMVNLVLACLNLIPVPPLDGGRVLGAILPPRQALLFSQLEPYGFIIIILLVFTGLLTWFIVPPIEFFLNLLHIIFHI